MSGPCGSKLYKKGMPLMKCLLNRRLSATLGAGRVFVMMPACSSISVNLFFHKRKDRGGLNGFYTLHGSFTIPLRVAFCKMGVMSVERSFFKTSV